MALTYRTKTSLAVTALTTTFIDGNVWVSPVIDNANGDKNFEFYLKMAANAAAAEYGWIDVYFAPSLDDGTTFAGGITTQSDAEFTLPGSDTALEWPRALIPGPRLHADFVQTIDREFAFQALPWMPTMPEDFKLVLVNMINNNAGSGGAWKASTTVIWHQGVYDA